MCEGNRLELLRYDPAAISVAPFLSKWRKSRNTRIYLGRRFLHQTYPARIPEDLRILLQSKASG